MKLFLNVMKQEKNSKFFNSNFLLQNQKAKNAYIIYG